MKIFNKTKKITLSSDAKYTNSLVGRMRGLMLSKKRDIVLDSRFDDIPSAAIHMLFMKYPIDVVWVNSKMVVVDLKERIEQFNPFKLGTWSIYKPKKPARYVIELGIGRLGTTGMGDEIKFM